MNYKNSNSRYPKVLIINGQSMYQNNATGITLRSLFRDYEKSRLMELCFFKKDLIADRNIVNETIFIPNNSRLLQYILKSKASAKIYKNVNNNLVSQEKRNNEKKAKFIRTLKTFFISLLELSPTFYTKHIIHKIDQFKPEAIYTMGSTIYILKSALYFSKRYNIKIVLHFMDNWRETLYTSSILYKPLKKTLDKTVKRIENGKFSGLAISDRMAEEYSLKSGKTHHALMNCIDIKDNIPSTKRLKNKLILTYAGGLHLNRWKELLSVQNCLTKFDHSKMQLNIYTSKENQDKYSELFNSSITEFKDFLPPEKVHIAYAEADILVHVESFDRDTIQFTKYSLSTKIPEYMSSGKPILCFAPKELAVSQYISKTQAGVAVDNFDDLYYNIKLMAEDNALRQRLGKKGRITAKKFHDTEHALQVLLNAFKE